MSEESESSAVAPVSYQHKYKTLKRKLKFLVYEQELFKEELDKCHKKLLRLTQDKSFLLDRLMRYESVYMSEDDTLSWLSDEESSSESTTSAPPPTKIIRKLQPTATTAMSASLKLPGKKESNGPAPCRENKSPIASKQLPQKSSRTINSKPPVTAMEITHTPVTPIPSSLLVRIPLPLAKQQQPAATPTAIVPKKTLGSGSSSLSSSDLSDSDSDANPPPPPAVVATTSTTTTDSVRKTILRVPHSTSISSIKTSTVTKQPSTITTVTTDTVVAKATTISQVMSKPTLTIPSQVLLKPLTGKNATSNISQRLASIYSPTQVKAFQLSKTVTSPKTTTGGTLPFAAFTWSNRTTTTNTASVETSSNNTGFTLLSPSNASKLQLPFTSLTSNQTGAFRVIAQTASVNTTNNDTVQQSTTQQ